MGSLQATARPVVADTWRLGGAQARATSSWSRWGMVATSMSARQRRAAPGPEQVPTRSRSSLTSLEVMVEECEGAPGGEVGEGGGEEVVGREGWRTRHSPASRHVHLEGVDCDPSSTPEHLGEVGGVVAHEPGEGRAPSEGQPHQGAEQAHHLAGTGCLLGQS